MIKVNVEIDNKSWTKKVRNPKKYLLKKIKKISHKIKFLNKKNIAFTILLTNSFNMKELNKKFRKVPSQHLLVHFMTKIDQNIGNFPYFYKTRDNSK